MGYKIFQIDTSINQTKDSFTRRTGQYFLRKFQEKFGQLELRYLDLTKAPLEIITAEWYNASHIPPLERTPEQQMLMQTPNMQNLKDCDIWLWDLPGYMFDAPACFRCWFEHTMQVGLTHDENGSPLLKNKRVIIISAWGEDESVFSPQTGFEMILRSALKLIGVREVKFFHVFNSNEMNSSENDVHKEINNYIADLQL